MWHTGETPHRCDFCSKTFTRKEHLLNHVRQHTGESPHRCGFCSKSFTRKEHLVNHIRQHTGESGWQRCSLRLNKIPTTLSTLDSVFLLCLSITNFNLYHSHHRLIVYVSFSVPLQYFICLLVLIITFAYWKLINFLVKMCVLHISDNDMTLFYNVIFRQYFSVAL